MHVTNGAARGATTINMRVHGEHRNLEKALAFFPALLMHGRERLRAFINVRVAYLLPSNVVQHFGMGRPERVLLTAPP